MLPGMVGIRGRGMRWMLTPLVLFAVSRCAIFTVTGFSLSMDSRLQIAVEPTNASLVVQGLTRWDAGWFLRIAREGYTEPVTTNFFPLFPLLGRWFHLATGLPLATSLVLCANICSLAAFIVVYRVFLELEGAAAARAALALLVAWPFSFFQAAAYPESLMMLGTATAIFLVANHKPISGGLALGLGMLARHMAAIGWLALLAYGCRELLRDPRPVARARWAVALAMPAAIVSIYFAFLQQRFGNWHLWVDVRADWGNYAWWGIADYVAGRVERPPEIAAYLILSLIPGIGACMLVSRTRWRPLAAFALCQMVLLWSIGLAGLGRYCGSCWPAFLPLGVVLSRRPALLHAGIAALAILQGMFLVLHIHLFPIL